MPRFQFDLNSWFLFTCIYLCNLTIFRFVTKRRSFGSYNGHHFLTFYKRENQLNRHEIASAQNQLCWRKDAENITPIDDEKSFEWQNTQNMRDMSFSKRKKKKKSVWGFCSFHSMAGFQARAEFCFNIAWIVCLRLKFIVERKHWILFHQAFEEPHYSDLQTPGLERGLLKKAPKLESDKNWRKHFFINSFI